MATLINASTSNGLVQTADNTGILQLQSNGTTVATLNSSGVNAGIQVASNAAPAFSVYQSVAQSVTGGTNTKVQLQTKVFDTNTNFDATTNYRFTPTVAGYYFFSGGVSGAAYNTAPLIYKNGTIAYLGNQQAGSNQTYQSTVSGLLYCNGTTDYVEMYAYVASTITLSTGAAYTYFQGFLARSA